MGAQVDIAEMTDLGFSLERSRACELGGHSIQCIGDEPARWFAIGRCPHCRREYNMLICEPGRKRKVTAPITGCGLCGGTFHWPEAITTIAMS